jgi:ABC-type polysaccharide/polyol phosphate transport system ATPase subunit
MSSEIAIKVEGVSKCYHIFETPRDRLKQFVMPRVRRIIGAAERMYYREFWALKDVSFEVRKGESVGILGRNGSGKSTLLQIITGILTPTAGSVETSGRIAALLELGSGFNLEFSGRENVYLNLALQGFSEDEIKDKFDSVASFAEIGEFIDQPVKTYSSGMYARLAFSAAIHTEPDVLIVDEILAVGDAPFQKKCINRLYQMLDEGVSVLMVSHDAYQVRSICERALLLQCGRQMMFDSSDKVMDEYVASTADSLSLATSQEEPSQQPDTTVTDIPHQNTPSGFAISICNPTLKVQGVRDVTEIHSMQPVDLEFEYRLHGAFDDKFCFVVNLYREDGVYIFGTTTRMQGLPEYAPASSGRVKVHFPSLPLVSGKYKFRVAVNDGRGLSILAEAVPVCHVSVTDDFKAVGIVDLPHSWIHEIIVPQ